MMEGSHYKQVHKVFFPPFSFFLEFVCKQAKALNDPSFSLQSFPIASTAIRRDKFPQSHFTDRRPVSVHKTDIFQSKTAPSADDPERVCLVHNKPHPLHKCRGLREMPLDERKRILKIHNICFKCCASNKHVARNCDVVVECSDCHSDKHPTVLHPDKLSVNNTPLRSPTENGGEMGSPEAAVVSKCTEVCGEGSSGKSCSKICLVNVYPAGRPKESKKMYTMLGDQSNRSLAHSEFFEMYNIIHSQNMLGHPRNWVCH